MHIGDGRSHLTEPFINNFNHFILDLRAAVVVVGVMKRLENLPKD